MKPKEKYVRCEHCDRMIKDDSPPSEQYERGQISISSGMVLLPKAVVESRHREGYTDSHAVDIAGTYCDMACLIARLSKLLRVDGP